MFASSTGREISIEDERWKNGAFTEALLEGLAGKADYSKDGKLTIAELDLWLSERVKELTARQSTRSPASPTRCPTSRSRWCVSSLPPSPTRCARNRGAAIGAEWPGFLRVRVGALGVGW